MHAQLCSNKPNVVITVVPAKMKPYTLNYTQKICSCCLAKKTPNNSKTKNQTTKTHLQQLQSGFHLTFEYCIFLPTHVGLFFCICCRATLSFSQTHKSHLPCLLCYQLWATPSSLSLHTSSLSRLSSHVGPSITTQWLQHGL